MVVEVLDEEVEVVEGVSVVQGEDEETDAKGPDGTHAVSVDVKDSLGQITEPVVESEIPAADEEQKTVDVAEVIVYFSMYKFLYLNWFL